MRSFVTFALASVALCGSPLDIVTGFTNQLALTQSQVNDANTCLGGLFQEVASVQPLYSDYTSGDIQNLIASGADLLENFEPAVQSACQPFVNDLNTYIVSFGNGQSFEDNLAVNAPYVEQQIASIIAEIAQQNFTSIGSTLGYIFQIGSGAVDLPSLAPQVNSSDIETLLQNAQALQNNQTAFTEYFQAYVSELGLQVNATAIVDLVFNAKSLDAVFANFEDQISTGDFDSDITAIENVTTTVLEFVRDNKAGIETGLSVDSAFYQAFIQNPAEFVGTAIYNGLVNAPQIAEIQNQQTIQDLIDGDFTALGVAEAEVAKLIFPQVY